MRFPRARIRACAAVSAGAFALVLVLTPSAARAQEKTYVMKVTGPTINDAPHLLAKYFAAAVERDSGDRIRHCR